jgi:hypothetical protein
MNILDSFRQNRNTFLLAKLLAASTLLTSVVSSCRSGKDSKAHYRHTHRGLVASTLSNNMDLQEKALKKNYKNIWQNIGGRKHLNDHLIVMSAMHNNVRNLYGVDNAEKLGGLLEDADNGTIEMTNAAIGVLTIFEGKATKSYKDNLHKKTGHIKNYKAFYNGEEKVSDAASHKVTVALLEGKGGYFNQLNHSVEKAVAGKGDCKARAMKPCRQLMLLSMIYQCPTVLTNNLDKTDPLLVSLCKEDMEPEDEEAAEDAMQGLITHYEDTKLLKLSVSESFQNARNTLLNRGKMLHAAALGDADAPQTVESIAKQLSAMRRDQKDNMIAIMVGKMPKDATLKDILQDPNCSFRQSTQATIVLPFLGVMAVKEKNADYFDIVRVKPNPALPSTVDISKTCHYSEGLLAQRTAQKFVH